MALVIGGLVILGVVGVGAAAAAPGSPLGWLILVPASLVVVGLLVLRRRGRLTASRDQAAEASVRRLPWHRRRQSTARASTG